MTGRAYTTVRVGSVADREAVIAALFAAGAEGVEELADGVLTHIADADEARIATAVSRADESARVTFAPTPDVDWTSAWRARIGAHRVGRLVVTPPWLADQFSEEERIVIEPEMAFGTGEHETTRGVLRLLPGVLRAGDVVADLGAGSAVLAIGAARLGAARVLAIELDPDAISNAEQNVRVNGVADRVRVVEGDAALLLPLVAPVAVILANIIWPVLETLLPAMANALAPGGSVILSGLLRDDRGVIEGALERGGWHIGQADEEGIWWSVIITRR